MSRFITVPGLDTALVGTFDNEHGKTVPVYSITKLVRLFEAQGKTSDDAAHWVARVIDNWDDDEVPIFIHHDPRLGTKVGTTEREIN